MPKSILIFGGSFDPIHCGHLATATQVQKHFHFDEIRFVPCGQPPHKAQPIATSKQRIKMLELALQDQPILSASISLEEIQRPLPSYTVDTLRAFRKQEGKDVIFTLLIGQDAFLNLSKWHESEALFTLAKFLVIQRPGYPSAQNTFDAGLYPISSSEIRAKVGRGESIQGLVSPSVERYILDHGLYKSSLGAAAPSKDGGIQ